MRSNFWKHIDWGIIVIYLALILFGIVNIYSAQNVDGASFFDQGTNAGQQVKWFGVSLVLALIILFVDARFFLTFGYYFFIGVMILLVITYLTAPEIKGARSWLVLGGVRLGQTSEFAKFATVLAMAKYMDGFNVDLSKLKTKMVLAGIMLIPIALILLQNDTGTAMVFMSLILVLFREGIPPWVIVLPVAMGGVFIAVLLQGFETIAFIILLLVIVVVAIVLFFKWSKKIIWVTLPTAVLVTLFSFGVNYAFNEVLKPHQQTRINVLLGIEEDIRGAGYNVHQSLITIGSGGLTGRGFMQGSQTRGSFVPEQTTDFIFCTIGEEYGFMGTGLVIALFVVLFARVIQLAERQKSRFARIFGYGIVSIMFCHFFLNISMTLGLFPVIGIPLPFFSYGGSSLMGFTIMLFIFLKLDAGLRYYF